MKPKRKLTGVWLLGLMMLPVVTCGAQPVTKIAAGYAHSLFCRANGSFWGMGNNKYGQLGIGAFNVVYPYGTNLPVQIIASNVIAIAAGGHHSLFVKSDGSLWVMGDNAYGQLGDGTTNNRDLPEQIIAGGVTAVTAGYSHSLFLKSNGSLWGMGNNNYGQLGDGTTNNCSQPVEVMASNVTAIAAGYDHSLVLKTDGSLWGMGLNESGQLGDGSTNSKYLPEEIVASNVTAISAGWFFSLFLKNDGSLWGMGDNRGGQLGDGSYNDTNQPIEIVASNVTAISAGGFHTLFLKKDGSLWAVGWNADGQLGDGTYGIVPVNRPEQIVGGGVTAIAGGGHFSLFLKNDASLWGMGEDYDGQLGDGYYNQTTMGPEQILGAYDQIAVQFLGNRSVRLSFMGIAGSDYALDRSLSLTPPNWVPQITNPADRLGLAVFTNTPDQTTNNFWRIRSVP